MIQNKLFRDCLAAIPAEQKAEFDLSFGIAERISEILKTKGLTQKDFARLLNKRDSEISKWLTGRHNFTTQTIARIETALGSKLISIAHWLGYAYKKPKKKDFARMLHKRDSEISKWLTGRHNFTTQTIARIQTALGCNLINIAH